MNQCGRANVRIVGPGGGAWSRIDGTMSNVSDNMKTKICEHCYMAISWSEAQRGPDGCPYCGEAYEPDHFGKRLDRVAKVLTWGIAIIGSICLWALLANWIGG